MTAREPSPSMAELTAAKAELRKELIGGRKDQLHACRADEVIQRYQRALKDVARERYLDQAVVLVQYHVDLGAPPERILTELRRMAAPITTVPLCRCGHLKPRHADYAVDDDPAVQCVDCASEDRADYRHAYAPTTSQEQP